ncbi:MAG TPA: hypothetical protein PLP57_05230 [Candidatus Saccharicenans sp.]|jgi:hypothetical protein|nr:hypothetical protein [Candidatus Saccharicenans sp.]
MSPTENELATGKTQTPSTGLLSKHIFDISRIGVIPREAGARQALIYHCLEREKEDNPLTGIDACRQ